MASSTAQSRAVFPDAQAGLTLLAPAKVNLALHVTGQRADGYHSLDSLVVFADAGDQVSLAPAPDFSLRVTGPRRAGVPEDDRNLCLRAARAAGIPVAITLEKHLPNAAGLGGGTADAAAVLRGLQQMTGAAPLENPERIGADLPVCLFNRPARMQGVGERISPVPPLPPLPALLINPGVALSTPQVFSALKRRHNGAMDDIPRGLQTPAETATWLREQRNDLQSAALSCAPEIGTALAALDALPGCLLARMSGSGASCFALFPDREMAEKAAGILAARHPAWWICPVTLG
ncbi:4-(cytidine 5'-diphospho)-2-C-methyl-D-erythritol kinase [Pseudooceanicola algae]|uniref:4-diphosphocytidyl-2-C-methyl-D-erythritol kinase n=1 Tax=Pseudooceanicola algae TaxID=1537215 RepID=A0A418SKF9_9RHOB|nr:4-(cytidine 5'-diphospho)-2-C-methyl-D-erythritol kinase [Pseudooceanicola algae]QPM90703.1 4-diphosphocytidyl-2-C-methyl-D-erythritol kinase [Pseudooceanicola algae]